MHDAEQSAPPGGEYGTRYSPPPRSRADRFVRRFHRFSYGTAVAVLYAVAATAIGVALAPALWFLARWAPWALAEESAWRWVVLGIGVALAAAIAGFALLVVVPVYNALMPTRVKPFRGGYFTLAAVPWYLHNGLFYLVRYTVLPWVTLTPIALAFLRAMGMRLGRRSFVNTEFISDPRLITLGDDVVIGGSVHLFAHYGGGGHLVIAPVVIGHRVTVGQKCTVMGDVVIGDGATVLPHTVLLPGSRVGAGEIWAGVPGRRLDPQEFEHIKESVRGLAHPDHPPGVV